MFGFFNNTYSLSADQFKEKMKNSGIVIDVRTPGEYKSGHIKGAVNIPLAILPLNLEKLFKYKDKGQDILIYCLSGGRSAQAHSFLERNGISNTFDLKGGIHSWNEQLSY